MRFDAAGHARSLGTDQRKQDGWAGLLLSLTLIKFHLFLLIPLALLLRRRWTMLGAYAAGSSILGLSHFWLWSPSGIRAYLELITRKDLEAPSPMPHMMIGVNSMAVNLCLDPMAETAPVRRTGRDCSLERKANRRRSPLVLDGCHGFDALSPHTYEYDVAALLVRPYRRMSVAAPGGRALRLSAGLVLIPLPYFLTVAGTPYAIAPSLVVATFLICLSGILPAARPVAVRPSLNDEYRSEADPLRNAGIPKLKLGGIYSA